MILKNTDIGQHNGHVKTRFHLELYLHKCEENHGPIWKRTFSWLKQYVLWSDEGPVE